VVGIGANNNAKQCVGSAAGDFVEVRSERTLAVGNAVGKPPQQLEIIEPDQ
jgi:hypothetical protein